MNVHLVAKSGHQGVDRTIALALDRDVLSIDHHLGEDPRDVIVSETSLESSWIFGFSGRYVVVKTSQIWAGEISVPTTPSAPGPAWRTRPASPGRSKPCSALSRYATPPFPDWEFTRMIASYVRPVCLGSIGR